MDMLPMNFVGCQNFLLTNIFAISLFFNRCRIHGGPIIMVQAENEFGSYVAQRPDIPLDQHKKYSSAIRQQLLDAGFDIPMFTSDGTWLFKGGSIEGALPTANGEGNIANLKKAVNQYHVWAVSKGVSTRCTHHRYRVMT